MNFSFKQQHTFTTKHWRTRLTHTSKRTRLVVNPTFNPAARRSLVPEEQEWLRRRAPARNTALTFQSRSNNPSESPVVTSATIWLLIGSLVSYQPSLPSSLTLSFASPFSLHPSVRPCCYPSFVPSPSSSDGTNSINDASFAISYR